jgi:hypothetical protein
MRKAMVVIFTLALVFAMSSVSNAQIAGNATQLYVATVANALTIAGVDGAADGLSAGATYTVSPDLTNPGGSINLINTTETATPMEFAITTAVAESFELTFDLPHTLVGTTGQIACSFSSSSLWHTETGGLFNPNVANVFNSGTGVTATFELGITMVVPKDAVDGEAYTGAVTCTANIVGM